MRTDLVGDDVGSRGGGRGCWDETERLADEMSAGEEGCAD
jgi:hypothetical protein